MSPETDAPKRDLRRYFRAETENQRPPHPRNGRKSGLSAGAPSVAGFGRLGGGRTRVRTDTYETALIDLINQKRAGKPIRPKERPKGENVVDLMEALRRSVGDAATSEAKVPKKSGKKPRKAAAGQKEMLMPIAGKKPAKETAAKKPAARSQRKSA